MKAVVMAGGEGTRLRPLTLNKPKPLMPVCNRPIMEHILERLRESDIVTVYATLHFLADEIQAYFGTGKDFGVELTYSIEESPLGTAGAVKLLEKNLDDTFLIVSGDAMTDMELAKAVKAHRKKGAVATIVLSRVDTPLEYGVVIIDDDGRVVRFLEKPGWGEVFSDTVNTGIYVLEPEVFKYIEEGKACDFSRDLFPALLAEGRPLFGCVLDGYWCDIGNLKQYREVHQDALTGRLRVVIGGRRVKRGLWIGENTEIHPSASIHAPSVIGSNCRIRGDAIVHEVSFIGDNCILEEGASVARSILWNNTYLGRKASATGAMVCQNNVIEEETRVEDGAIIGDNCNVGKGSIIRPQVKIWPDKIIESGSSINMSIVWAQNWPGSLFSALGVKGIGNIQITPEYAARLGSAFGACLPKGCTVITSRSPHKLARVIKRSIIAGLMSVGVNVTDARMAPIPLTRHLVRTSNAVGGVHVRISPYEPEMILIEFFNGDGINIGTDVERKVEAVFFRQDYRRTDSSEVGQLEYDPNAFEPYSRHFLRFLNVDAIRGRRFKLVIDYSHGSLSTMLPPVLSGYGCEVVSLNAFIDPNVAPRPSALDPAGLAQLSAIVRSLNADLGILVDGESEKISIVDGAGRAAFGDRLLVLMVNLVGRAYADPVVATQIRAPLLVEAAVKKLGGRVVMTKANSRSLMAETLGNPKICFGGDTKGGFMFPEFQPVFDAMVSLSKILELTALHGIDAAELNASIPEIYIEQDAVSCTWDAKGRLMRVLVDRFKNRKLDLTDGIKLSLSKKSWALIRPDPAQPLVHVIAEGASAAEAKKIVGEYRKVVAEATG
ncbi:MAG: sugar phosphate nucleotidyltransferase [bacterium]